MDSDFDLDVRLALEEAYADWVPVAETRDAEWAETQWEILAEFDRREDDALWDELELLSTRLTYREYLNTQTWKVRAERAKRWGFCQRCRRDSDALDAHHLTYERLFKERPSDLMALCRRCHEEVHGKHA